MTTIANRRRWVTFVTVDALLLLGTSSAMAAPVAAPFVVSVHLPSVLLVGISLVWMALAGRHAD